MLRELLLGLVGEQGMVMLQKGMVVVGTVPCMLHAYLMVVSEVFGCPVKEYFGAGIVDDVAVVGDT